MRIKTRFIAVVVILFSLLTLLAVCVWLIHDKSQQLYQAEYQRAKSIKLADQLRQSSDDLTRMVRAFVTTGENRYQQYFEEILSIREGKSPRPENYDGIYWDYIVAAPKAPRPPTDQPVSLISLFEQLNATDEELSLLTRALDRSNQLTLIEFKAIGLINDAAKKQGLPNQDDAVLVLYSDEYLQAKANIMRLIDQFSQRIHDRTTAALKQLQVEQDTLLHLTVWILVVSTITLIYVLFSTRSTLIRPIMKLSEVANHIKDGHTEARVQIESDDEIGVLAQSFNGMNDRLGQIISELESLSYIDPLTQLANRRMFDKTLQIELRRHTREKKPIGLMLIDIDFFKNLNDSLGHQAGDQCLADMGNLLSKHFSRAGDLVARYGGEEFIALLPNTDLSTHPEFIYSVLELLEYAEIHHPDSEVSKYLTVSVGAISLIPDRETCAEQLLKAADDALYQAKQGGRNRAILA